jgi:hypothetical protein
VIDTITAVEQAGMIAVGGGADAAEALDAAVIDVAGVEVAVLAFDVSGGGLTATAAAAGIATWDEEVARRLVAAARRRADVVVVGIHGGLEGWRGVDPLLAPVAAELVSWGVDVVWGHGPHVVQPVGVPEGGRRPTVVASSLGNFLFDQQIAPFDSGLILEVLVDQGGVIAFRTGTEQHRDLRSHFTGWQPPAGDAVYLDGDWWELIRPPRVRDDEPRPAGDEFAYGDVVASSAGVLDGDGEDDVVVSYRHPARPGGPYPLPTDREGRTAHLGVFTADLAPRWMSRRPPHPVAGIAACDGAAAFAYTGLDDDAVVATGAGRWNGFGFSMGTELTGPGSPGCADVDGNGLTEPVVTER